MIAHDLLVRPLINWGNGHMCNISKTTCLMVVKVKVAQSCPTLCDRMNYTVRGILHSRILEWIAFPSPGDLPNPGMEPRSPALQADSSPSESLLLPLYSFLHPRFSSRKHSKVLTLIWEKPEDVSTDAQLLHVAQVFGDAGAGCCLLSLENSLQDGRHRLEFLG